ncbi:MULTISPECIES: hypothetical protein [unclassified Spiroplasma]|uniref:hypothetical protein n=1 Tax=unclassified Spiroplasma TaxID=2637901 RepID=UPI0030D159AA
MSEFEKQKVEQSIKDFKENVENCYVKISSLENKKIWSIDFYDWNKEINSKIKLQNNIIEHFNEKISKNKELLLKFKTKNIKPFFKKGINNYDKKIEKSKLTNINKGQKIKPEILL